MLETEEETKLDDDFCPVDGGSDGEMETISTENHDAELKVKKFAQDFGITRLVSTSNCPYDSLEHNTRRKKENSAAFLFDKIGKAVAKQSANIFLERVCNKLVKPEENDKWLSLLLQSVAEQFFKAENDKMLRLYALSIVADLVSHREMAKYIPNLSPHVFAEAKKIKKVEKLPAYDQKIIRIRYNMDKYRIFLDYVTG